MEESKTLAQKYSVYFRNPLHSYCLTRWEGKKALTSLKDTNSIHRVTCQRLPFPHLPIDDWDFIIGIWEYRAIEPVGKATVETLLQKRIWKEGKFPSSEHILGQEMSDWHSCETGSNRPLLLFCLRWHPEVYGPTVAFFCFVADCLFVFTSAFLLSEM